MQIQAKKILIQGRVQGVGFRQFTVQIAHKYNIEGTVKNLPDGSVECIARGKEEDLNHFINSLKKGPPLSKVLDLKIEEISPKFVPSGFKIIY